jgi:hypothetical protein
MPGRGLTLANDPVQWGERVETYGYPFPVAVPDQVYPDYKALHFYSRFLCGLRELSGGFGQASTKEPWNLPSRLCLAKDRGR